MFASRAVRVSPRRGYSFAKLARSFSLFASHSSCNRRTSEASCFSRDSTSSSLALGLRLANLILQEELFLGNFRLILGIDFSEFFLLFRQ